MIQHPGHTPTVYLTIGLPGSGKSTWAKNLAAKTPCVRRVSRDDLRYMLLDNGWKPRAEQQVVQARDALLRRFLQEECCVVMDETFLNPKMKKHVRDIVASYPAYTVQEYDFLDVDIDTCIERDLHRGERAVGAGVIRKLAKDFLRAPAPLHVAGAPEAIICDLDGTLSLFGEENPYDRDFSRDQCNPAVARILQRFSTANVSVILTSGRHAKFGDVTRQWLKDNDIPYNHLWMRPEEKRDMKDSHFKAELYRDFIKGNYNVLFVLDDRDQVVDMWRLFGLTVLQVEYGAF